MQRDYELAYILNPEVSEEEMRSLQDRVEQVVANYGGQIVKVNQWGRRRLAYPIERHRDGVYTFVDMILTPETVAELERTLKVSEIVLRQMIKKRDHKAVQKEREEREEREARAALAAANAANAPAESESTSAETDETSEAETDAGVIGAEELPVISTDELEDVPPAIEQPETIDA